MSSLKKEDNDSSTAPANSDSRPSSQGKNRVQVVESHLKVFSSRLSAIVEQ